MSILSSPLSLADLALSFRLKVAVLAETENALSFPHFERYDDPVVLLRELNTTTLLVDTNDSGAEQRSQRRADVVADYELRTMETSTAYRLSCPL